MEYEATIPSRYMLGSTLGTVLACSRKAKEPQETILNTYRAHHGPVRALQRNPLFPKNFLTAGDRSMKVACIYNIYSIYRVSQKSDLTFFLLFSRVLEHIQRNLIGRLMMSW